MRIKHPIKCYDNGGKTLDRYTIVLLNQKEGLKTYCALGCNSEPFFGIGQHTTAQCGRHLGKLITYNDLPEQVQKFVIDNLDPPEYRALMYFEHTKPNHDKKHYRAEGKKYGLQYAGFWDGVLHFTRESDRHIIDCYEEALTNGDLAYFAKHGLTLSPID